MGLLDNIFAQPPQRGLLAGIESGGNNGLLSGMQMNAPFGELRAYNPTPSERMGDYAKGGLMALGMQPYSANRIVNGVGNILGWTPAAIPAMAADAIYAKSQGDNAGVVQAMAGMIPGAGKAGKMVAREAAPAVRESIRAYHGSPHDFDRFDLSKINTGEGNQKFGHGLYFAENEAVANSYKELLGKGKGKTYEVGIKADPSDFIDYGAPLSQQPKSVLEFLQKHNISVEAFPPKPQGPTGSDVQRTLQNHFWSELDATKPDAPYDEAMAYVTRRMSENGIPGVKYLDRGSRDAAEGTRNYVVFDDKLIDILKKYGIAGIPAAGVVGAQFNANEGGL